MSNIFEEGTPEERKLLMRLQDWSKKGQGSEVFGKTVEIASKAENHEKLTDNDIKEFMEQFEFDTEFVIELFNISSDISKLKNKETNFYNHFLKEHDPKYENYDGMVTNLVDTWIRIFINVDWQFPISNEISSGNIDREKLLKRNNFILAVTKLALSIVDEEDNNVFSITSLPVFEGLFFGPKNHANFIAKLNMMALISDSLKLLDDTLASKVKSQQPKAEKTEKTEKEQQPKKGEQKEKEQKRLQEPVKPEVSKPVAKVEPKKLETPVKVKPSESVPVKVVAAKPVTATKPGPTAKPITPAKPAVETKTDAAKPTVAASGAAKSGSAAHQSRLDPKPGTASAGAKSEGKTGVMATWMRKAEEEKKEVERRKDVEARKQKPGQPPQKPSGKK